MKKGLEQNHGGILIILFVIVLIILLGAAAIYEMYFYEEANKTEMAKIFAKVENSYAELTKYMVYGTHLNVEGEIKEEIPNIKSVKLILKKLDETEEKIDLEYKKTDGSLEFYTSDLINERNRLRKNFSKQILYVN